MGGARVTVVIPTRNRAGLLRTALESVLAQTAGDLEIVVADNASDDATPELLASVRDPRLRVVRRAEDVGLVANFQLGAREVTTPYALFLGDDDVLHPEMLEATVRVLDRHPDVGMVHTAFDLIGPDGQLVSAGATWNGSAADSIEAGLYFVERSMSHSNRVNASAAVVRSAVARASGWFRTEDSPWIDLGLWLRIALRSSVAYLHRSLVSYRIQPQSFSASQGRAGSGRYHFRPEALAVEARVKRSALRDGPWSRSERHALERDLGASWHQQLLEGVRAVRDGCDGRSGALEALAQAVRTCPSLALDARAWLLLGATLSSRTLVGRARRGLGRTPIPSSTAV